MSQCASVRSKTCTDRCNLKALNGLTLCGRHAHAKQIRLWSDVHSDKVARFVKVQALCRGWFVRRLLTLAGAGVLKRAECVNDEELVTLESKDRQHPFEYFGIVEAGKIWWFDFASVWEWSIRSVAPLNPYTRVPLAHTDLARLRKIHLYRRRHGLPVPPPTKDIRENILRRWTVLSHIFRGFGFDDTHPAQFANLNHANIRVMFQFLIDDIAAMDKPDRRLLAICSRGITHTNMTNSGYVINSLNLLAIALTDSRSYDVVFLLLSALYRC